jgi:hypothetical protein
MSKRDISRINMNLQIFRLRESRDKRYGGINDNSHLIGALDFVSLLALPLVGIICKVLEGFRRLCVGR